jgi:hypothetical protein
MIRKILKAIRIESTPRAKRWNEVRTLDANSAKRRRVEAENRAEVEFNLRRAAK